MLLAGSSSFKYDLSFAIDVLASVVMIGRGGPPFFAIITFDDSGAVDRLGGPYEICCRPEY